MDTHVTHTHVHSSIPKHTPTSSVNTKPSSVLLFPPPPRPPSRPPRQTRQTNRPCFAKIYRSIVRSSSAPRSALESECVGVGGSKGIRGGRKVRTGERGHRPRQLCMFYRVRARARASACLRVRVRARTSACACACACVCACVCVRVRVRVRVSACVSVRVGARVRARGCVHANHTHVIHTHL
jgi:hypothetical protein